MTAPVRVYRTPVEGMSTHELDAAAAAGATGAAIVLGASIFTPNVVDAGPSFQKSASAVQELVDVLGI